ncbi:MAG: hypothetical protein KR126chlam3_01520 [Chlamydiae bacterium]|nr:hypothetical protein [Chlamydiota bacterium]
MIAGPNGAGKTTTALEIMTKGPDLHEFINTDEIARGLAPLHPESVALSASKLMIERLKKLLLNEKSFAFETTAAGKNYVKHLEMAKSNGYEINLIFLWLASHKQAVQRVAQRVKQGGHHVPEETIIRRYYAGIKNLMTLYLPLADVAIIVNNSAKERKLIARKEKKMPVTILEKNVWGQLEKCAYER